MLTTIYQTIRSLAETQPETIALLAPGKIPCTYSALFSRLDATLQSLNQAGLGRNDRLVVVLPNGPEMAAAFLSIAACSACAPLNPAYRAAEYEFYLSDLDAQALIILEGMQSPARSVADSLGIPVYTLSAVNDTAGDFTLTGPALDRLALSGPAQPEDTALILHTSGTTSRPKMVPLTQANLAASARNIIASLQLTPSDRCLNIMPLFHIHGLMAALYATLTAGGSLICSPGFFAPHFFDWLDEFQPTWYTAVPTMHQAILTRAKENEAIITRSHLRFIRSCSASLPPQVLADLEAVFSVPVIEAYGMTEAAHQMTCNPLPPLVHKSGSVGIPTGTQVAIMTEDREEILSVGTLGEVVVRGENVTTGYLQQPEANVRSFTPQGWFRTGDQGYLDQDGYLFLTGRLKEIINRGGEKISPREIDEVLLQHPAVQQAVTFAMPDDVLGEDVAAAVVLRDAGVSELELRRFAALHVSDFKVPRRIIILEEIPKGPTGKLQRIGLAEKLGLQGEQEAVIPADEEMTPPQTAVEGLLADLWCQVLCLPGVGIHQRFLEVGGDSILAAQLAARIDQQLDMQFSLIDLFDHPTIAQQAALIEQKLLEDAG
jgi:acyl-CoA synthetase (AMP-forming)/AMP-acid ligase II